MPGRASGGDSVFFLPQHAASAGQDAASANAARRCSDSAMTWCCPSSRCASRSAGMGGQDGDGPGEQPFEGVRAVPGEFHLVGDQTTAGVILGAATFLIPLVDRALNKALRY